LTCDETVSLGTAIVLTFAWGSPGRAVPHAWQKRADSALSEPQCGQKGIRQV
jgi:hypothetical protein